MGRLRGDDAADAKGVSGGIECGGGPPGRWLAQSLPFDPPPHYNHRPRRGPLTLTALFRRVQAFSNSTTDQAYGSTPRIDANLVPQRIFGRAYASLNTEYAYLPNTLVQSGVTTVDRSVGRVDILPSIRIPLSNLTFLTATSSASYRTTYYTRSLDDAGRVVPEPPWTLSPMGLLSTMTSASS